MKYSISLLTCFCISLHLFSQHFIKLPAGSSNTEMLEKVFDGKWDKETESIKWKGSPSDLHELGGTLGDGYLYTKLDTAFIYENSLYLVAHTSSYIKNDEGKMENANSCHSCGTYISLLVFDIIDKEYSLSMIKKNMGQHGCFGEPSYILKLADLGDGYVLLQVDDSYSGMGITSTATTFYYYGSVVLSMISGENNAGSFEKHQTGYYEYKTKFIFNKTNHTIKAVQSGTKSDENTNKIVPAIKTKLWTFDGNTLQF